MTCLHCGADVDDAPIPTITPQEARRILTGINRGVRGWTWRRIAAHLSTNSGTAHDMGHGLCCPDTDRIKRLRDYIIWRFRPM